MADLLLELFSEEIPARMQADAERTLVERMIQALAKAGFADIAARAYSTPRRLALLVMNLPAAQADVSSELKGPKIDAPEAALQGFLKKSGLTLDKLEKRDGVYIAKIHQKGRPTVEVLKDVIEEILKNFPWPKSMRWGSNEITWVRPLHSILCIFDGNVVPVEFGTVKAGNVTYGHRFLAPKAITIKKAGDYEAALEKACVLADREKRKAEILTQAEKAASAKGLQLKKDDGLLEEVTGLVEWPVVLTGTIDAAYRDLPPEVLVSEMRAHQKYFALQNAKGISDTFLITANMETKDKGKAIISGNERVLRARLADGRFFWDQDRKKSLDIWAEGLKSITFHAKLGTVADKVERIKSLAVSLMPNVDPGLRRDDVERAASLCKADLVTGMVGEFPELQGIMGRYYALAQNESPEVADAIREHYLPLGPTSEVPKKTVSICIALADKLDTLISMFAIGEKPTGSKDPFALRRAALGIIRIILENNIRLPLIPCFAAVPAKNIALHSAQEKLVKKTEARLQDPHKVGKYLTINETAHEDLEDAVPENLAQMLYDFFIDRLKVQLKDSGIRHDVINAVVFDGDDDLVRVVMRAKALQDFLSSDDGASLLIAYRRAANISNADKKKENVIYSFGELDKQRLEEAAEKNLADLLGKNQKKLQEFLGSENYVEAMKLLATFRNPIDLFFEKVMVNCEDTELRKNRLCLLAKIQDNMDNIANFSLIEGDSKEQKKAA